MSLETIGKKALQAKKQASSLDTQTKNKLLQKIGQHLWDERQQILEANQKDLKTAVANGMPEALQDRLALNESRIQGLKDAFEQVASLEDPIGEVLSMKQRPNGLLIGQKRVPLGVVGVIYEARPNVTADVFALCFKTGNVSILKGGKDAFYSNQKIVELIREVLEEEGLNPDLIQLIEDNSREATRQFMKMNGVLDVLIPRGGAGLIQSVVENANVPVIETGTGNCHVYVDKNADYKMATEIILNGKTQRVGVCNAVESILIHEDVMPELLGDLVRKLQAHGVEVRLEPKWMDLAENVVEATEEDWGKEYLDYIVSIKSVKDVDEAIDHINRYSTHHSETIVTPDYANAQKFLDQVDSAAVYVNASTRFTDGNEFGFGAEIGISTQKLHARGPMGLPALTSTKYIIYGQGQTRP